MGCCWSHNINEEDEEQAPLLQDHQVNVDNNMTLVQETAERMLDINVLVDKLLPTQILNREEDYKERLASVQVDDVFEEIDGLEFEQVSVEVESREFEHFLVEFE